MIRKRKVSLTLLYFLLISLMFCQNIISPSGEEVTGEIVHDETIEITNELKSDSGVDIYSLEQDAQYRTILHLFDNSSGPVNLQLSYRQSEVNITSSSAKFDKNSGIARGNITIGETIKTFHEVPECVIDMPPALHLVANHTEHQNSSSYLSFKVIVDKYGEDQCADYGGPAQLLATDAVQIILTLSITVFWVKSSNRPVNKMTQD